MIKHFYKYTILREEFFSNLLIRATQFTALNDPFEGVFSFKQFKNVNKHLDTYYKLAGYEVYDFEDEQLEAIMSEIKNDFLAIGVLSFSEDYSNPLMWAHYADEHRGIVLEFDYNQSLFQDSFFSIKGRMSRFKAINLGDCYEFPEKVMYRREMPSFDNYELSKPKVEKEYPFTDFFYSAFYTKSNDWIYEKELRSIVPLNDADVILCKYSKDLYKSVTDVTKSHTEIKVEIINKTTLIKITFPNEFEKHEEMGDESIKQEIYFCTMSLNCDNLYFYRINPKAITGIYCGYRCDIEKVKKLVCSNQDLVHLKDSIFKMEIADSRFELISKK